VQKNKKAVAGSNFSNRKITTSSPNYQIITGCKIMKKNCYNHKETAYFLLDLWTGNGTE